jgi:hypothetical protein
LSVSRALVLPLRVDQTIVIVTPVTPQAGSIEWNADLPTDRDDTRY